MNVISPMIELIGPSSGADVRRQLDALQPLGDHLTRAVDVGAPVELHPDHRDAVGGDAAQPADAGGAVDGRLDRESDQRLDLLGRHAGASVITVTVGAERSGKMSTGTVRPRARRATSSSAADDEDQDAVGEREADEAVEKCHGRVRASARAFGAPSSSSWRGGSRRRRG